MELRSIGRTLVCCGVLLLLPLGINISAVWGGPLRITMNDGTSVETPYFWEENGEIKFEIPGGVAGIPKSQVASIQEVITENAFDPAVLLETPAKHAPGADHRKVIEDLIAIRTVPEPGREKVGTEESLQLLQVGQNPAASKEQVRAPEFKLEGDFAEMVRVEGGGLMLVMRNVLSSQTDLKNRNFALILYDMNGKVIQRLSCQVSELDVDTATLRKLGIRGRLYSVMATVRPDSNIKRYEITAVQG